MLHWWIDQRIKVSVGDKCKTFLYSLLDFSNYELAVFLQGREGHDHEFDTMFFKNVCVTEPFEK